MRVCSDGKINRNEWQKEMSEVVRGSVTREEYLLRYYSWARVCVRVRCFASLESIEADCAEKCLERV